MRGFTFVELVLVTALLGVLGMVIGPPLYNAINGYDLVTTRRLVLAESRAGVERMVKEIRLIPSSTEITALNLQSFQFQYPVSTNITYSLSGTNLMRNSDILIQNVLSLTFTYYDEDGLTTSTPANVRSVGFVLTIDSPGAIANLSLRTRTFIPNTGNNYANFTSP